MVAAESSFPNWPQQWKLARASRRLPPTLRLTGPTVTARMSTAEAGRCERPGRTTASTSPALTRREQPNPPMMAKQCSDRWTGQSNHSTLTYPHKTDSGLTLDQASTHDTAVRTTGVTVLNEDRGAPRQTEHDRALNGDDWFARSHNDGSFNSAIHASIQQNNDGHGHDHHSNSGELNRHATSRHGAHDFELSNADVAFGLSAARTHGSGDTFHFKDKVSVLEVSDAAEVHHGPAPSGHRGHAARTSEPPAISEAAIEMASPGHHASDNSNHHWFDHIGNGPDHAWSGANNHAQHHDLMV